MSNGRRSSAGLFGLAPRAAGSTKFKGTPNFRSSSSTLFSSISIRRGISPNSLYHSYVSEKVPNLERAINAATPAPGPSQIFTRSYKSQSIAFATSSLRKGFLVLVSAHTSFANAFLISQTSYTFEQASSNSLRMSLRKNALAVVMQFGLRKSAAASGRPSASNWAAMFSINLE